MLEIKLDGEIINKKNHKPKRNIKKNIIIYIAFFIFLFIVVFNHTGLILNSGVKQIIGCFETDYLYQEVLDDKGYVEAKDILLKKRITTKGHVEQVINKATKLANDEFTFIYYNSVIDVRMDYDSKCDLEIKSDIQNNVLEIQFNTFNSETPDKMDKLLNQHIKADYIILDLRDNGGGSQNALLKTADLFLDNKAEIMTSEFLYKKETHYAKPNRFKYKKIFVLLNENSASCSEILALTLKENLRDSVELIGKSTRCKSVGQYNHVLETKFNIYVVNHRWFVKDKNSTDLNKYLYKYQNDDVKLDNKEDYLNVVNSIIHKDGR